MPPWPGHPACDATSLWGPSRVDGLKAGSHGEVEFVSVGAEPGPQGSQRAVVLKAQMAGPFLRPTAPEMGPGAG